MIEFNRIRQRINEADAILIGASNGFSISEGLNIFDDGLSFENLLGDFKRKYGMRNILEGYFTHFETMEEYWGYISRLVSHYSGNYKGSENTQALFELIGNKPYFFVTSNGENHFELAGFDPDNIYEIEGGFKYMQCLQPCHLTLYPAIEKIKEMSKQEKDGKVPSNLIPYCPHCGKPMILNAMVNSAFIPNEQQQERLQDFIQQYHDKKIVVLELGIGWRNQMIKKPLMDFVASAPLATYITINKGEVYIPAAIQNKSYGLDGDLTQILKALVYDKK